jgi:hypothetical protein
VLKLWRILINYDNVYNNLEEFIISEGAINEVSFSNNSPSKREKSENSNS